MAGPWPYGETVTLLRRSPQTGPGGTPVRDQYGQIVYGDPQHIEVPGCVVAPRETAPQPGGQEQQARDTIIVGFTVYAPSGTQVLATDQVLVRGATCEITGQPGDWARSPFTGTAGPVQFAADLVTG